MEVNGSSPLTIIEVEIKIIRIRTFFIT